MSTQMNYDKVAGRRQQQQDGRMRLAPVRSQPTATRAHGVPPALQHRPTSTKLDLKPTAAVTLATAGHLLLVALAFAGAPAPSHQAQRVGAAGSQSGPALLQAHHERTDTRDLEPAAHHYAQRRLGRHLAHGQPEEAALEGDGEPGDGEPASADWPGQLDDETTVADDSQEAPDRNSVFMQQHRSQLKAMHDLFERRQLNGPHRAAAPGQAHHQHQHPHQHQHQHQHGAAPLQSSQELSPISIGLEPGSPFSMAPFPVGPGAHEAGVPPPPLAPKPHLASADNLDQGLGPALPFGLNPLPQLMGFQSAPFDGPQRGDQSAHSNHHAPMADQEPGGAGPGPKVWPKIFRFTDGRINLSEFEKQKKIRLSNKSQQQHGGDNYIESAPIMFDGRQLKRKSFLILHGGIFSR